MIKASLLKISVSLLFFVTLFSTPTAQIHAQNDVSPEPGTVFMFGRDDCGFCKAQSAWMDQEGVVYQYLNIVDDPQAKIWYDAVAEKHSVSKVTPITVVGEHVFVGFNGPNTTGKQIKSAIDSARNSNLLTIDDHLALDTVGEVKIGSNCTELSCNIIPDSEYEFDLPVIGIVDLKSFSLITLSAVLGVIDGFNPCAMWVLITFIVLLSQAGSRRKMIFLAGIFVLAQGIMYNLILNVWYKTWDFVALDQYVTPLVGFIALGGGSFFLWRWYKNRSAALVCDVSDIESQSKTIEKFKAIAHQPVTIASVLAILVIAFSVNVIEFACSVGIPQAYTKILEMNMLSFIEIQGYVLVYTIGYMLDDVIVFGLAIWGFSRLQSHGAKYAHLSLLIGGLLMLVLGAVLVFNPALLVL